MIEQNQIAIGILFGFLSMLLMAGFIVVFAIQYQRRQMKQEKELSDVQREYQKSLLETALDSEEAERRRMAGELHDDIGVMLSLTKMSVNQLQQGLGGTSEDNKEMVLKIRGLLDETMTNVRRISKALVPTTLEQFGLEAAVEDLIIKFSGMDGTRVRLIENGQQIPRLAPKTELTLFRVIQELVNNALKHANASTIGIEIYSQSGRIWVRVRDNGSGFDADAARVSKSSGLGLKNIESRLSILNGSAKYERMGEGTSVVVSVPLVSREETGA